MSFTTNDDAVDDVSLLEQAQFLTVFQRFYSYQGSPSLESISPADLREVFEYRRLCQQVEELQEDARISRLYSGEETVTKAIRDPLAQAEADLTRLKDNPRLMQCAALVERFEVWTCKALSKHLLLSHKSDTDCSSKLLHIPTASHVQEVHMGAGGSRDDLAPRALAPFAEIWNSVYNENKTPGSEHFRGLGVPPDAFTWPEFLRVAYMISLLPHEALRQQVHSSLCIQGPKEHKERCGLKFQFRLTDLVALWCRSRFCSMSKRHLLSLFVVTREEEEEEETPETTTVIPDAPPPPPPPPRFKAVYKGNHRSASRCFSVSPLVDALVEYAVLNQVLFTQHKLLHAWKHALQVSSPERPLRPPVSSKRMRHTHPVELKGWPYDRLRQACQSYILRNFCRRHPITCVLLYADEGEYRLVQKNLFRRLDGDHRDIIEPAVMFHHPLAGDMIAANVLGRIRESPAYSRFTDRKLQRIDRRIRRGYYNDTTQGDLFYHNVSQLLKTLGECAEKLGFKSPEFEVAVSDFRQVYREEFCGQVQRDGLFIAAQSLLDDDWYEQHLALSSAEPDTSDSSERNRIEPLEALLNSTPAPWVDKCSACEGQLLKGEGRSAKSAVSSSPQIIICASCDRFVHPGCASGNLDSTTMRGRSFVKGYEPLKKCYSMSIPANASLPPDFRNERAAELKWDMKVIELRRTLQPDGSLPVYGMVVKTTQHCADALDRLLSGSYLVSDFDGATDYPVAFSGHSGCVISDVVPDSLSHAAGCKKGDLIIAIAPSDIAVADGNEEVKFLHSESYTLAKLSYEEVLDLLRLRATKLRMIVARPQGSVAQEISEWTRQVSAANEALVGSLHANDSLWFCENCRVESNEPTELPEDRIGRDARRSLAVIRRLKQESYGRHWKNEDHVPVDSILNSESEDTEKGTIAEVHASCVSLVRLECMMQWILGRSSNRSDPWHESAFFVGNRRLEWAPVSVESDPYKLLCHGISLIARAPLRSPGGPGGDTGSLSERTALLSLFLRLFCTWCLGPTLSSQDPFALRGPPLHALTIREQAENMNLCPKCLVRHVVGRSGDACLLCQGLARLPPKSPPIDAWACSYETRASLVGATVLILPKDPIATNLSKTLRISSKIKLEHLERPIEYVVVSYLTSRITMTNDPAVPSVEGTYQLLPVVSPAQLKFLLERCKLRQDVLLHGTRGQLITDDTLRTWSEDVLLNLAGVLSLTYEDLLAKMDETSRIEQVVTLEVAVQAGCSCVKTLRSALLPVEASPSLPCNNPCCKAQEPVSLALLDRNRNMLETGGSVLVETIVQSRSPLLLAMLQQVTEGEVRLRPPSPPELLDEDGGETHGFLDPLICCEERKGRETSSREIELLPFVHPPERRCRVLYSDIVQDRTGANDSESSRVTDLQLPPDPALPSAGDMWTDHLTAVVLSKNTPSKGVVDVGWGIELVQWENDDDRVRIGRVVVSSPADHAGLKGTDEVVSVNGKPLDMLIREDELMNAMLSLGLNRRYLCFASAIECAKETLEAQGKSIGPIVLGIKRKVAREQRKSPDYSQNEVFHPIQVPAPSYELTEISTAGTYYANSQQLELTSMHVNEDSHSANPSSQASQSLAVDQRRQTSALSGQPVRTGMATMERTRHHSLPVHSPLRPSTDYVPRRSGPLEMPTSRLLYAIPPAHPPIATPTNDVPRRSDISGMPGSLPLPLSVRRTYTPPYTSHQANGAVDELFRRLSYVTNPLVSHCDLYKQGLSGSVLSLLETSVLAKAVLQKLPMLGLRMLSPRYNIQRLFAELHVLARHQELTSVPRIDDGLFTKLTHLDFMRSEKERGEVVFFDLSFSYRMPISRFPIDRLIESHFSLTGFSFDNPMRHIEVDAPAPVVQQTSVSNHLESQTIAPASYQVVLHRAVPDMIDLTAGECEGGEPDRIRGGGNAPADFLPDEHGIVSPVHLGTLPDARKVLWFHCDTRALYVSPGMIDADCVDERGRQLSYQQDVRNNFPSCIPSKVGPGSLDWWCVWGCSNEANGERCCIGFASSAELHAHIHSEHSFCQVGEGSQRLDRVAEGAGVRRLFSAITVAACARSSDLLRLTIPSKESHSLFCFDDMQLKDDVDLSKCSPCATDLLGLARNIAHLFDSSGKFRLDAESLRDLVSVPRSPHINTTSSPGAGNQDVFPVIHRRLQCPVCDLGTEPLVEMESDSPGGRFRGVGCSSHFALCFGIEEEWQTETTELKSRLLSFGNSVPEMFRVAGSCVSTDFHSQLWSGDHFRVWTDFVLRSRSIQSLCQAFVVLMLSVDRSKLPAWWDVGGWHDAQLLMQKTSQSALMLHLRVLDAAIAEAASLALLDEIHTPPQGLNPENESSDMSFDELVKKTLQLAKENGISRWKGESEEFCPVCWDGGDLYCCELCPNVCHQQCVYPPIDKDLDDDDLFVCNACIVDVRRIAAATK